MSTEIKIGDIVDCSGWARGGATIHNGMFLSAEDIDGECWVGGPWSDGDSAHWVRRDQITRHVPASSVAEKPKSAGDKLASEMTVRERMIVEGMNLRVTKEWGGGSYQPEEVIKYVDALIAALDKETHNV